MVPDEAGMEAMLQEQRGCPVHTDVGLFGESVAVSDFLEL